MTYYSIHCTFNPIYICLKFTYFLHKDTGHYLDVPLYLYMMGVEISSVVCRLSDGSSDHTTIGVSMVCVLYVYVIIGVIVGTMVLWYYGTMVLW
jgi:hypothetical protein